MNYGFEGRKLCLPGKHDITLPDAIGTDFGSGKRYCRACQRERKRAKREAAKQKQRYCRGCQKPLPIGRAWAFCTTRCESLYRSRNSQEEGVEEAKRTLELMTLHAQLDRAATSWERADIKAKIAAVK